MGRIRDIFNAIKALPEGSAAPNLFGFAETFGRRISNRAAARFTQTYGGQESIDYVMECVNLYARTASRASYHWERNGQRLVENPRAPEVKGLGYGQADADLVELFAHPNRQQDYTELMELSVIDLLLAGEFFWYKNQQNPLGQPKELWRIPPAQVEVEPGRVSPKGYVYHPPGDEEIHWQPDQVVHVKLPNPHDPWRGLSMIAGNPNLFDTALALDDSVRDYYERGTRLTGVVESERPISDSGWEKMKRQFTNMYSGRGRSWQVAWLQRAKFTPLSANAAEAQFGEAANHVRDRIAALFGIPTPMLGDVGGSTDRQAVREAQRIFDNKVMRPFLDSLQHRISDQLTTPAWQVDYVIEYEYVMPPEDKLQLAQVMSAQPITVAELRAFLGFEPLGDERDEQLVTELLSSTTGKTPEPPIMGKTPMGDAPYPAGAAGRRGEPTTADGRKAELTPEMALRATLHRMRQGSDS